MSLFVSFSDFGDFACALRTAVLISIALFSFWFTTLVGDWNCVWTCVCSVHTLYILYLSVYKNGNCDYMDLYVDVCSCMCIRLFVCGVEYEFVE